MDSQLVKQAFGEGCSIQTLARLLDVDRVDVEASLRGALGGINVAKVDPSRVGSGLVNGASEAAAPELAAAVKRTVKRANGRPKAQFLPPVTGEPVEEPGKDLSGYPPALRHHKAATARMIWDVLGTGPKELRAIADQTEGRINATDPVASISSSLYRMAEIGLVERDDSRPRIWSRK